jgi:hypothetical protein
MGKVLPIGKRLQLMEIDDGKGGFDVYRVRRVKAGWPDEDSTIVEKVKPKEIGDK